MSEDEINITKHDIYKTIVKEKVKANALNNLNELKSSHSKMNELVYTKLELSQYLRSPIFNTESMEMLLALRTRTVRGIRNYFRGMYSDAACPLGCGNTDTLSYILSCNVLQASMDSTCLAHSPVQYSDVYSTDIVKQREVTHAYAQLLKIREELLNSLSVAITGPVHYVCNSSVYYQLM